MRFITSVNKLDLSDLVYGKRPMTLWEAKQVRELKKGCTYRFLAEACLPEKHELSGNQGIGESLCREALKLLYPNDDVWMMYKPKEKFGQSFYNENKSHFGEFYWWE
jgi:hypothetical protein